MFEIFHNFFDLHEFIVLNSMMRSTCRVQLQSKLNSGRILTNFVFFSLCVLLKFGIAYILHALFSVPNIVTLYFKNI